LRFLRKANGHHGTPEKITIERYNAEHKTDIEIRQVKYLTDVFDKTFLTGGVIFSLHG